MLLRDQEADNTDSEASEEKECSVVIDRVISSHPNCGRLSGRRQTGGTQSYLEHQISLVLTIKTINDSL